jgi:hypothetical protein
MRWAWLLLLLLFAAPAAAQEAPPVCNAVRDGVTACLAGKLCLCRFERGGQMTGRSDGYRWDCGALRPECGEAAFPRSPEPGSVLPMPNLYLPLPARPPRPPVTPMPPG